MSFRRELGRFDTAMVVVGGIIGAGIFINPYIVAQRLDTPALVLGAWLAGGVVDLAGALTFAELGTLFPKAGGHYAYLREAYHPLAGFLYGWGLLLMIEGGAIAAVAITFGEYTLRLVDRPEVNGQLLAILGIVVVAAVNYVGVKPGSRVLNTFVILKLIPLALLIGAGLILPGAPAEPGAAALVQPGPAGTLLESESGPLLLLFAFGAALIPVMFSYGGWQNANYVAEEMKDPREGSASESADWNRNSGPRLRPGELRLSRHAGAHRAREHHDAGFGCGGSALRKQRGLPHNVGDRVSTFGFLNLTMLAPTRVYYAMARDGLFPETVARLQPKYDTPSVAIVVQTLWAIVLVLTGTYAQLVDFVVSADWFFFGLAGAAVFVFRRKIPLEQRAEGVFPTPGYPFVPGLFVAVSVLILGSVIWNSPVRSGIGFAILALGVPAYLFWSSRLREGGDAHG